MGLNLKYWKEKLKEDLYYITNIKLYIYNFHEETNGIAIRKENFTKTFKQWLSKKPIGDVLLEEIERRKDKIKQEKLEEKAKNTPYYWDYRTRS